MTTPAIQNDFSYYRRTVMRGKLESNNGTDPGEDDVTIDHQLANKMSLFYANSTPMLKILSEATSKFVTEVSTYFHMSVEIVCISKGGNVDWLRNIHRIETCSWKI